MSDIISYPSEEEVGGPRVTPVPGSGEEEFTPVPGLGVEEVPPVPGSGEEAPQHDIGNVPGENEDMGELYFDLKKIEEEQDATLQAIEKILFTLANYHFVFQGVCVAVISNNSFFVCTDAWYVCAVSVLAAIPNLFALVVFGLKYMFVVKSHDRVLKEALRVREILLQNLPEKYFYLRYILVKKCCLKIPLLVRQVGLSVGLLIYFAFTAVVWASPWLII